ncbi:MAG: DUF2516 family protein [Acidimicrobiales bacterium]|nr:DUF2516 family protein [Acidimicrobiales bacterium]
MNIGFQESAFFVAALATLGLAVFCLVDVVRRPKHTFKAIDHNKMLWVIVTVVAPVACWPASLALSIFYLRKVRPELAAV